MSTRTFQSPWLTRDEAVEYGRVTVAALETAVAGGLLRSRQLSKRCTVYHVDWVDAWLMMEEVEAS